MSKIIASKTIYPPQCYVELMTGNFYIGNAIKGESVVKDIKKLLAMNNITNIKSFAINDIEKAIVEKKKVVLVDCSHYVGDMFVQEYRWFQINRGTKIKEEK